MFSNITSNITEWINLDLHSDCFRGDTAAWIYSTIMLLAR